jgi:hypothetical protein
LYQPLPLGEPSNLPLKSLPNISEKSGAVLARGSPHPNPNEYAASKDAASTVFD